MPFMGMNSSGRGSQPREHSGSRNHREGNFRFFLGHRVLIEHAAYSTQTINQINGAQMAVALQHPQFFVTGDGCSLDHVQTTFQQS